MLDLHFSDRIHYKEIFALGVPITILRRVPKKNPIVFYRLFKLCKNWKPDLIHSWSSMSTLWVIPSSIFLKIKIINGNIADAPFAMKAFDPKLFRAKLTFPFSKVIVGNSLAGLSAYNVPKSKGICIYNGFDINRISNLEEEHFIKEKFQIKTEKVVGMVGSFYGNKDYQTYVEVALSMIKQRDDVTFIAVGDGTDLSRYQQMIPKEFASRFIFTGLQNDVESIINVFDIGVLSTYTEGISNAILEYMALEKPTVATRGGGTVEIIENGKTGFLIPPSAPEKMIDKLNYLLDNEMVMKKMGKLAKQRLENVFGIQKMMLAYYQLYTEVNKS